MDKVDSNRDFNNLQNQPAFFNTQAASAESKKNRLKKTDRTGFSSNMERSFLELGELGPLMDIEPSEEALQELLDNVRSAGDMLKQKPLAEEIIKYKKEVRNFLNYVVKNVYECSVSRGLKHKKAGEKEWTEPVHYRQIKIIDDKLNKLAEDILVKHIRELEMDKRLNEITGLLVDITITGKIKE